MQQDGDSGLEKTAKVEANRHFMSDSPPEWANPDADPTERQARTPAQKKRPGRFLSRALKEKVIPTSRNRPRVAQTV